ncbi:hypothetical protein [Microbispora amethystogenes]|uniref:Solute-binding protein family 3/N-terminal domain-containing protein n=1 Tax=Microbispora amethystogenes TaxID=1427754 RepID=A0ABQ4FM29_9ACTN|nr:hypothetical protein [Microbispora amethystogenes]GIH35857.1 hypothetical protein Mam01_60210 [Microbispora amethystogenes]
MNGDGARRIGFEWALEGKEHGSYDEYGLLRWSAERLAHVFDKLRARYAAGTPSELPQVTIVPAGLEDKDTGEQSHNVVLAIHTWSDNRDFTGRKVAYTRWFFVPYHQLQDHPVSYQALYAAFDALPPTPEPPLTVAVPALDPRAVMPGPDALAAAALLASGQQVCLVGADGVPMAQRLRFVDTVMALLPYGLRTRFSAATWTSSTTKHRIKLSFARYAPEGVQAVQWGQGADIPQDEYSAKYHRILRNRDVDYPDLIGWLAGRTEPLSFNDGDRPRVFDLLHQSASPSPPTRPAPKPTPAPAVSRAPEVVEAAHQGPTVAVLARKLAGASRKDTGPALDALLAVVWTPSDREALADALFTYTCFHHVIDQQDDRDHLYERLVSAAFQPDEQSMWKGKCRALLRANSTPKTVRRLLKGLSRQQWWQFGTWARRHRLACTVGVLVFAVAFASAATLRLLLPGDDAPAQQALPLPPPQKVVLVRDAAAQPYVTEVVKEALRRAGYQPDAQVQGAPSVLIGYDPAAYDDMNAAGLTPVGDFPSSTRDVLLVRGGEGDIPKNILVRKTFSKDVEKRIRELYPESHLIRVPDSELTESLIKRDAEAAIVSDGVAAQGYTASDGLRDLLPERRIVVGADSALKSALEPAMDGLKKEGVTSSGNSQADAKAFVDRIYSPAPALASSAKPVSEPPRGSGDLILITSVVAAVAGLAGAVLLVWRPSRFKGSLIGRPRV